MNGIVLSLLVLLAADAVRSQGPPTRTRKGTRPVRTYAAPPRPVRTYAVPPAAPVVFNPFAFPAPSPYLPPLAPARPVVPPMNPAPAPAFPAAFPLLPTFYNVLPNPPPPAIAPAVLTCAEKCPLYGQQVCSKFGTTFDNDCYRKCSGEPLDCQGPCPCPAPFPPMLIPHPGGMCANCRHPIFGEGHSPVCVEDEETMYNECEAKCSGKIIRCDSPCPCY